MKQAFDFSEHQSAVFDYYGWKAPSQSAKRKVVGEAYLTSGLNDWIIEDADGKIYIPDDKKSFAGMIKFCREAPKPIRITLAIHEKGDGIAFRSRRKTIIEKPKTFVWFIDDPDPDDKRPHHLQDGPIKNLVNGMPPTLWDGVYNLPYQTAHDLVCDCKVVVKVKIPRVK